MYANGVRPEAGGSARYSAPRELVLPTVQYLGATGKYICFQDFLWLILIITQVQRPWHPAVVSVQLAVSNMLYALTLPLWLPTSTLLKTGASGTWLWACNLLSGSIFITCISFSRFMVGVHPFFT